MRDIDEFETALELLADLRIAYLEASELLEPKSGTLSYFIANAQMAVVCKHTNAFLSVARISEPGSHVESGWTIMRTLYEASVTACWLVGPENSVTQQDRLLKYLSGEVEHGGRMQCDVEAANPSEPPLSLLRGTGLEHSIGMAAGQMSKQDLPKKPSFRRMMKECGIQDSHYTEFYSLASHRIHGGSSSILNWFDGKYFRDGEEPDYAAWFIPLQGAAWSLGEGGAVVMERQRASKEMVEALRGAHTELSEHLAMCAPEDETTD